MNVDSQIIKFEFEAMKRDGPMLVKLESDVKIYRIVVTVLIAWVPEISLFKVCV